MKPGGAVAARTSSASAVAFSWEQEPGVSKHNSPVEEANKNKAVPTRRAPGADQVVTRKQATTPAAAEATTTHRRLRVPPPPPGGCPGAPPTTASPPGRGRGRPTRSRGAGDDDPFLAAYLACTGHGRSSSSSAGRQKRLGWAGLRLAMGYGLALRGLGLSCKTSCQEDVEEETMVRLPKINSFSRAHEE